MRLRERCVCSASFDLSTGGFGEMSMTPDKVDKLVTEWREHHRHVDQPTEIIAELLETDFDETSIYRLSDKDPWTFSGSGEIVNSDFRFDNAPTTKEHDNG